MHENPARAVVAGKTASTKPNRSPNVAFTSRHAAKCRICNHPDRAAIEFDFLNWRNPADLARSYRLRDISTVYRHAHATGLFAKRRLNLRFAMERIVERVNEVPVTATAVIRAARAIARINDEGQWVDPPSRLIVTHTDSGDLGDPERSRWARERHSPSSVELHPRPAPIFDAALLDEPSESAVASGEMPKIPGKAGRQQPEEVILTISPEFYRCREERNRGIEEDRLAKAAKDAASIAQRKRESNEELASGNPEKPGPEEKP